MNTPKYIIIHCSATKVTNDVTLEEITKWHKAQGFKNIGYHYYITKDGTIHKGRDEKLSGAHTVGYNSNSIGICYEGGLDKNGKASDTRTLEQKQSLIDLILDIKGRYEIKKVMGHRDTSPDLNKDGKITPNEYIKSCPCFDALTEYKNL